VDQKIASVYPAVNYNKAINPNHNTFLSIGFTGGYIQYSFDPSKATFNNQYLNGSYNASNPSLENIPNSKFSLLDVGAGINYNTSSGANNDVSYIIGVSGYHFSQPVLSYYKNPKITQNIRWNGNAAVTAGINDNIKAQFQVNYALEGTYQEVMVGGLVNYAAIYTGQTTVFAIAAGAFYRYGDAIIPVVKVKYQNIAMGISYDVNLSSLKEASNFQGGAEVTLFLSGNYTDKSVQKKTVCPKF
jgi:type IX secretion system PorP/SprF family membrane protein